MTPNSATSEKKEEKNSTTTAISTEEKSPFLNYDYEEVPFLPYESYEDYYSSVVEETTHGGEFKLISNSIRTFSYQYEI